MGCTLSENVNVIWKTVLPTLFKARQQNQDIQQCTLNLSQCFITWIFHKLLFVLFMEDILFVVYYFSMNMTIANIAVHVSWYTSLGYMPRNKTSKSWGMYIFDFLQMNLIPLRPVLLWWV